MCTCTLTVLAPALITSSTSLEARQQLAFTDTLLENECNASALNPSRAQNHASLSHYYASRQSTCTGHAQWPKKDIAAHHISVQSVGMCTLPEMSSTECFVLVGVVQNCSRSFALLVQGAALLYLTGHALPCSHLLYSSHGTTTHVTDPIKMKHYK